MSLLSDELLTEIAHTLIILGVAAAYLKSKRVESLLEIQKDTIETLRKGFDACKDNLDRLEKIVDKEYR